MSGDVTRELSHFCGLLGSSKVKDRKVSSTISLSLGIQVHALGLNVSVGLPSLFDFL